MAVQLREDIRVASSAMKGTTMGAKKSLAALEEQLPVGEQVIATVLGKADKKMGVLALTNRRVMFVSKEGFGGVQAEDLPLSKVSGVSVKSGMFGGELTVQASGNDLELKKVAFKEDVEAFVGAVREQLLASESAPAPAPAPAPAEQAVPVAPVQAGVDPMEQLKKLGELHAAGILTDEEFSTKKADILERM